MDFLFYLNSAALGVGLAMDAFSVSLANGLREPKMSAGRMCAVSGIYAAFQYAMPIIGWICVHTVVSAFSAFEKFIPWIALILLLIIGGKTLLEGLRERTSPPEEDRSARLTPGLLLAQGVATSIDALSVGFTIADYGFLKANISAVIIGLVTFVICVAGLIIGKKAGTKLSWKASALGGIILIAIGIEIFIKGVFF